MRALLLSMLLSFVVALAVPARSAGVHDGTVRAVTATPIALQTAQPKDLNVDINVNRGGGGVAWYRSPVWVAIAIVGGVVVLLLLALAIRGGGGGGTTVVR